jgi:hypothetical protein
MRWRCFADGSSYTIHRVVAGAMRDEDVIIERFIPHDVKQYCLTLPPKERKILSMRY